MNNITVEAVNPDNKITIDNIVKLFSDSYGSNYPVKSIYDPRFWHSHIGSRFYSLILRHKGEIVAHFGIIRDETDYTKIRIVYPAVNCAKEQIPEVRAVLKQKLQRLAQRQEWQHYYYFLLDSHTKQSQVINAILGGHNTTILPNYFANKNGAVFICQEFLYETEPRSDRHLFLPREISAGIQNLLKLYRPLKLSIQRQPSSKYAVPAEKQAIQINTFAESNVSHILVEPSLLGKKQHLVNCLTEIGNRSHVVIANVSDPAAVKLTAELFDSNYLLTGFIFSSQENDRAIFIPNSYEIFNLNLNISGTDELLKFVNNQSVTTHPVKVKNASKPDHEKRRLNLA